MIMLGITLLAIVVFFMYMWKSKLEKKQECSTCPSKKNADTY
jgi:uncharacterized ion transporter superfamily protein YfcC